MPVRIASRFDLAIRLHEQGTWDGIAPKAVVALPARDEGDRIEASLSALLAQGASAAAGDRPSFGIVLLANNCRDETLSRAGKLLAATGVPYRLHGIALPPERANAGFARGLALDIARLWLERAGVEGALLTTDADTRVAPDWIKRNLGGLSTKCSAVAGRFELDPLEEAGLPPHLRHRRRLEAAYEAVLLALLARLDPLPHDPWPNHWTASGASFALTLSAYRRIGGQPEVKVGEDRALAAALIRHDIPIRHDPAIVVTTSARLDGRAAGGCAATLRRWCDGRDMPGDEKLEALPAALRRVILRRQFRKAFATQLHTGEWESRLALPPGSLVDGISRHFGELWTRAEALSPLLVRQPLRPIQMEQHLRAAVRLLAGLERTSQRGKKIEPIVVGSLLSHETQHVGLRRNEAFGRFITRQRVVGLSDPVNKFDMTARHESARDAGSEPCDVV